MSTDKEMRMERIGRLLKKIQPSEKNNVCNWE